MDIIHYAHNVVTSGTHWTLYVRDIKIQMDYTFSNIVHLSNTQTFDKSLKIYGPRQANLCLRAFRRDKV